MIYLLFASLAITVISLSLMGLFIYKNSKLKSQLKTQDEITSNKRLAKLTWNGFHNMLNPSNTWSVTFELREIATSIDETKSKFEVISICSSNDGDKTDNKRYTDLFKSKTEGGWLDTENAPGFCWITVHSKSDLRQMKIDNILNK